jgi:hypothetical protein
MRSPIITVALALLLLPVIAAASNEYDLPPGSETPSGLPAAPPPDQQCDIYLDADSPATGSLLETTPLVTPFGTITCPQVEVRSSVDPEALAAGSAGDCFDIVNAPVSAAEMTFDFDVTSVTFLYGGNIGGIRLEARDGGGIPVDTFFQADTGAGQPAGPATVSGPGIRSLYWEDPGGNYAYLDNLEICVEGATPVSPSTWGQIKNVHR